MFIFFLYSVSELWPTCHLQVWLREILADLQAGELQFQILTDPEFNLPFRSTFPQEHFLRKKDVSSFHNLAQKDLICFG